MSFLRKIDWRGWAGIGLWLLVFLTISADVIRKPLRHTTTPTYQLAATRWWEGIDCYTENNHDGFLYFPQAAILFTPFARGGLAGEILWRAAVFLLFAYALTRLARIFLAPREPLGAGTFLVLSLLAIPCSFASLRNAQFDLPLAALLVLATAEVAETRWTAAAVCLCLALALKPLAIVPVLLFGALHRRHLVPRLTLGLLTMMLVPFLHWSPAYVAHEYMRCAQTLLRAAQPHEPRYSDLAALLAHLALYPSDALLTVLRVISALLFLALGALALRKRRGVDASWSMGALAAIYLMLFNPRTETCSYVFLGPFVATMACRVWLEASYRGLAYALGLAALGLACDAIPPIHYLTDRWLKPLIALLFLAVAVLFILRREKRGNSGHEPTSA